MVFEEDVAKMNFKSMIIGSVIGALGFLVALSWRDTIQEFINTIVPEGQGLLYKFISSILITILAMVIAYVLIKFSQKSIREFMKKTIRRKK